MAARTRRDALGLAVALGGALLVPAGAPARARSDAEVVAAALEIEQTAAVVYDELARSGVLDADVERVARLFRDQEERHVEVLSRALGDLGGKTPPPPQPERVGGLAGLRSQAEALRFAIELETRAVAAYYDAQRTLRDPRLLLTAAQIMAAEGQHLAVLRPMVRQRPVPDAFETG